MAARAAARPHLHGRVLVDTKLGQRRPQRRVPHYNLFFGDGNLGLEREGEGEGGVRRGGEPWLVWERPRRCAARERGGGEGDNGDEGNGEGEPPLTDGKSHGDASHRRRPRCRWPLEHMSCECAGCSASAARAAAAVEREKKKRENNNDNQKGQSEEERRAHSSDCCGSRFPSFGSNREPFKSLSSAAHSHSSRQHSGGERGRGGANKRRNTPKRRLGMPSPPFSSLPQPAPARTGTPLPFAARARATLSACDAPGEG